MSPADDKNADTGAWRAQTTTRLQNVEQSVIDNTAITSNTQKAMDTLRADLSGIIKFSQKMETTLSIGQSFGALSWWLAKIAVAFGVVWAVIRYIVMEALKK